MLGLRGIPIRRRSLWVWSALTLPASLPAGHPWMAGGLGEIPWRELLLVSFALYLFIAEVVTSNRSSLQSLAFTLLGYVWISWGFGLVLTLRYTPDGVTGLWYLAFPVLAIIATDVGGYVFGSLWGKRPLAPRISPKKTIEGAIGGQGLAMVVVGGTMALLPLWTSFRLDVLHVLVFAVVVPLAALAGDLFESLVKRWVGVKDAGVFLPGHGGVLDRHRQPSDRGTGHLRPGHPPARLTPSAARDAPPSVRMLASWLRGVPPCATPPPHPASPACRPTTPAPCPRTS